MSTSSVRSPLIRRIYTDNPFYAISAALMAYGVLKAYGELEIGAINCWLMMLVLAGYTSVLAAIAVLIVRFGKVWDDARSVLLIIVMLFLAVSVSADDLFVRMTSREAGILLLFGGYLFSAVVSELVLRGTGIRLGMLYRVPYHMTLVLFYVAPWWCAPQLHPRSYWATEWMLTLFPVAAAFIALCLLPAARRGPSYSAADGPPWQWPAYPWTLFVVLAGAVAIRSFVLCMSFGPRGRIWTYPPSDKHILFDTIWGPYFLVPLALASLLVMLELGLTSGSRRFQRFVLVAAPALLLLAVPVGRGVVFSRFLNAVVDTIGSPLWLTVWGLIGFYCWAWMRRVPGASIGLSVMCLPLIVIGPRTIDAGSLVGPYPWPALTSAAIFLFDGLRRSSPELCAAAACLAAFGLWHLMPESIAFEYRFIICYHVLWLAAVVLGLAYRTLTARAFAVFGALLMPASALAAELWQLPQGADFAWRFSYVVILAAVGLFVAWAWRQRLYLYASALTVSVALYHVTVLGFRRAVDYVGRPAMNALAWSIGMLLVAFLISSHKAGWLRLNSLSKWRAETSNQLTQTANGDPQA